MSANKRWRRHKMCDVHFGRGFFWPPEMIRLRRSANRL